MKLSVVVSTLNDREQLLTCLDSLADRTPSSTEVIVVNGPSSDGTTGVVRDRDDVDVLVEISERNPNVSRNAGLELATGDVVAFIDGTYEIEQSWYDALQEAITGDASVVTGPITGEQDLDVDPRTPRTIAGRRVWVFDGDNVAFDRTVLDALEGFDEYLEVDGARDCAHRVAGLGFDVCWTGEMAVRSDVGTDGGVTDDWGLVYRSLSYRLSKNYGPRPTVVARLVGSAIRDGVAGTKRIGSGDVAPTEWVADGLAVVANAAGGFRDGIRARYADRSAQRNPHGISVRHDRAVRVYDRR